jgi:ABC-type cobalamin transport system ATPase subunit
MNHKQIKDLQARNGLTEMQNMINSGRVWHMEGSMGRSAASLLEEGACMLPRKRYNDAYGNRIPARQDLKRGTKGTFLNSINFWSQNDD